MREIEVPMPKLSMTMEEGELITWRKGEGDQVRAGEVICEVNSDKVEMEVESPADGTLVRHAAAEGDIVPVGAPIATLATEAEDLLGGLLGPTDDGAGAAPAAEAPTSTAAPAGPPDTTTAPAPSAAGPKPVVPAARRRAAELGVDLAAVTGTGRDGLVRVGDVEAAAVRSGAAPVREAAAAGGGLAPAAVQAPVAAVGLDGEVEELPLSSMRRVVARRLVESVQSTPHFYLTITVDAQALVGFRAELNRQVQARGEDLKVSVNDLVVKACAVLLRANPELNVSWGGDRLLRHRRVHVGIAVALEGGLIVPVIRDADQKSLTQVAREAKGLIGRARAGRLAAGELSGGTFTVSNLGMFGIDQFTAVINPPEAAILAVGAALAEPVATAAGGVVVHQRMRLTLSIDHRALDGATGAGFLQQLKGVLEHPLQIVA
ncbi:MAG TPA: dihydrolipoamide acetyltransferase family protein [Acidimicrobiales bacterium]|jgi:pyruvate dehydrogenase E2 component (dihydrolipoamide acetyltransferase)